jgi:hypothetical protein
MKGYVARIGETTNAHCWWHISGPTHNEHLIPFIFGNIFPVLWRTLILQCRRNFAVPFLVIETSAMQLPSQPMKTLSYEEEVLIVSSIKGTSRKAEKGGSGHKINRGFKEHTLVKQPKKKKKHGSINCSRTCLVLSRSVLHFIHCATKLVSCPYPNRDDICWTHTDGCRTDMS